MLCIPFRVFPMSAVIDLKQARKTLNDKKVSQWLLDGGMPKFVMAMITASIIDMRRLVGHPTPDVGVFSAIQFRRQELESVDVWQIGRHDIFPIQFIYNLPFSSEGIEHLYHSNDHEFVFATYSTSDATDVIKALVKEFNRKKKLVEDDAVSPLLYVLNAGIARCFEMIKPSLVMGGFNEKTQAFMVHLQSATASVQWALYYDEFLSLPLDPPQSPSRVD